MSEQKIQILGLRCSGTNYLEQMLLLNFKEIKIVNYYAFKHVWGAKMRRPIQRNDNIKIIIIVRNPYDWLRSVHREPHHCPELVGLAFSRFIKEKVVAYKGLSWNSKIKNIRAAVKNNEILESFENVIDMRIKKYELFNHVLRLPGGLLIKYEDLRDMPDETLKLISEIHSLKYKRDFISIDTYKKTSNPYKLKRLPRIKKGDLKFIQETLDWKLESLMGYNIKEYEYNQVVNLYQTNFYLKSIIAELKYWLNK